MKKLVYLDGQQAVLLSLPHDPSLGRNFEALDPLKWLARMSDHIPDLGQHRTILYGEYAIGSGGRAVRAARAASRGPRGRAPGGPR